MKKLAAILVSAVFLTIFLTACDDSNGNNNHQNGSVQGASSSTTGIVDSSIIDNYIYFPQQISMHNMPYRIQGAMLHGELIYFWYADSGINIVVASIADDGGHRRSTEIPISEEHIEIGGLQFTDEGDIEIVYSVTAGTVDVFSNLVFDTALYYGIYTPYGEEISIEDLSKTVTSDFGIFNLSHAVFTAHGYTVMTIAAGEDGYEIVLLDSENNPTGQLSLDFGERILALHDGRVVVWSQDIANSALREICIETGGFGETFYLTAQNFRNLFCAGEESIYDFLIYDGVDIIGYELDTSTAVPLFNWEEANLGLTDEFYLGFLQDGRMFVLYSSFERGAWNSELFILSRKSRADVPDEPTVITLGGAWVSDHFQRAATDFNRSNQGYRIEIRCYNTLYGEAFLTRFNLDMITNRGPDIIVGPYIEILEDTVFLACLYSFIDLDPELSRSDFFPSILSGLESRDGRLQFISSNFDLSPFLALSETMAQVGELTFENIVRWLSGSNTRHFGDGWMNREWFVRESLLTFSDEFIDFENGIAHLDSDEFVDLLKIAYTLPGPEQIGYRSGDEWAYGILNGDHIFFTTSIWHVNSLRLSLADTLSVFGDIIFVGVPSSPPHGQHEFGMDITTTFSINAGSPHQETAWRFLRDFLTANIVCSGENLVLPLRIDLFETLIAESMIPNTVDGVEVPQVIRFSFPAVYAMTEDEAATLRGIIDNATIRRRRNETLENIISEGLQTFFAGATTAEDTARVMQSRVSIYLAERN